MMSEMKKSPLLKFLDEVGITYKNEEDIAISFYFTNILGARTVFGMTEEEKEKYMLLTVTLYPHKSEKNFFDISVKYNEYGHYLKTHLSHGESEEEGLHIEVQSGKKYLLQNMSNIYDLPKTIKCIGEAFDTTFYPIIISYSIGTDKSIGSMENLQRWLINPNRKKKANVPFQLTFDNKQIIIDGKKMKFPLSAKELSKVLGDYETVLIDTVEEEGTSAERKSKSTCYVFHQAGLTFRSTDFDLDYIKEHKAYTDDDHNIMSMAISTGLCSNDDPIRKQFIMPNFSCDMDIFVREYGETLLPVVALYQYKHTMSGDFIHFENSGDIDDKSFYTEQGKFVKPVMVFFELPKPKATKINDGLYDIKPIEDALHFDNINFKLTILEALYNKNLIQPKFDLNEFAKRCKGDINFESYTPLRPVVNYFKSLPIPKHLADEITEIYMDGGNDIYAHIIPNWDGEDEYFDLKKISEEELSQFKNLKKATIMSENKKVYKTFEKFGIEVASL